MKIAQQIDLKNIPVPTTAGLTPTVNLNDTNLTFGQIVSGLVPYFFLAAGVLLLLYLLWGGISLMLTQGDPKAIESAKGKITSALIGFVIIFVAYWLVQIVASILGLSAITQIFKFAKPTP